MGFSEQEYWSGSPFPSPGNLPNPGVELGSPASQADSLPLSHQESPLFHSSSNSNEAGDGDRRPGGEMVREASLCWFSFNIRSEISF